MHELSITRSVLCIALEEAALHNAKKIRSVTLLIGAYSGAVPDCIEEYFKLLSRGTIAEGAHLYCKTPPARILCRACGYEGETRPFYALCPQCQSADIFLLSGTEFCVDSLEVD